MRIRQETVERHTVEGLNEEEQAVFFERYHDAVWHCTWVSPKPTDGYGRFSPTEFRAVFERIIEEKEVAA